jgi:hypothetical protein
MYNRIHVASIYSACLVGEERLRNVTYLFLKFIVVKMGPFNVV